MTKTINEMSLAKHEDNMNSVNGDLYITELEEKQEDCWVNVTELDIDQTLSLLVWTERLRETLRLKCLSFEQFVSDVSEVRPFEMDNLYEDELKLALKNMEAKLDRAEVFRLLNL